MTNTNARTLGPSERIIKLENGAASDDGLNVMFDIITKDEKSHSFWLAGDELEKIVAYVINLSQFAAGESGKLEAPTEPETRTVQPIEATALAVVPGRVQTEGLLLAVHLGTFALTFAVPANQLQQLYRHLGQMLTPIEPKKPS